MNQPKKERILNAVVIVAALGYFVDIYDLLLFSIVRVESLRSMGFAGRELEVGAFLNNVQMTGLMIGGIAWGMIADKKGRLTVLFGSIFLYSVANFLNAYVTTLNEYALCRFFGGLGLAGELGAGITLVTEVLPPRLRGYGTMIVATVGVSGAVVGGLVAQVFDWRLAFKIGGALGFLLLLLRIGVSESGIFEKVKSANEKNVPRGNFWHVLNAKDRFSRFILCIVAGVPIWYTIGILVTYSPEFANSFQLTDAVLGAKAIMFCYLGFVLGDFFSGLLSQLLKSRLKALKIFILLNFAACMGYLFFLNGSNANMLYFFCVLLGTTGGYWAVVVTMAAEQFGTNLRGTVATSVPNFIRFSLVPMNLAFLYLKPTTGMINSALVVGLAVSAMAFIASFGLKETFGKSLDYVEEI